MGWFRAHAQQQEVRTAALSKPIPALDSGAGGVRVFTREDIPSVVALRRTLFRHSEQRTDAELESYLQRLFFTGPLADTRVNSLVYADERGEVGGFLGVVPRQMLFGAKALRVAVGTQLMVAPHCRGLAARKLVRALIQGPQDLTISDSANDAARRIWSSVGGRTSLAYSFFWTRPLRPVRFAAMRAATNLANRVVAYAARPLCAVADAALSRRSRWLPPDFEKSVAEPLDAVKHLPEIDELLERWSLRPRYFPTTFENVLSDAAAKRRLGVLQSALVRDTTHQAIGWFVYVLNRGGISAVVQFGAAKGASDIVLAHLVEHARLRGAIALSGRFDPFTADELTRAGASFRREGPWMLYHSRHPGVEGAIESGNAFLSRLDGEWWMNF